MAEPRLSAACFRISSFGFSRRMEEDDYEARRLEKTLAAVWSCGGERLVAAPIPTRWARKNGQDGHGYGDLLGGRGRRGVRQRRGRGRRRWGRGWGRDAAAAGSCQSACAGPSACLSPNSCAGYPWVFRYWLHPECDGVRFRLRLPVSTGWDGGGQWRDDYHPVQYDRANAGRVVYLGGPAQHGHFPETVDDSGGRR